MEQAPKMNEIQQNTTLDQTKEDTPQEKEKLIEEVIQAQKHLFGFMVKFTRGNHDLAQEFTQEAVIRAVNRIGTFKHNGDIGTWLTTIAINLARDYFRNPKNRKTILFSELDIGSEDSIYSDEPDLELQIPIESHENAINSKLDLEKIKATLSPGELETVKILDEKEPYAIAAKRLGVNESTIKLRVFHLREKLFKKFKDYNK